MDASGVVTLGITKADVERLEPSIPPVLQPEFAERLEDIIAVVIRSQVCLELPLYPTAVESCLDDTHSYLLAHLWMVAICCSTQTCIICSETMWITIAT